MAMFARIGHSLRCATFKYHAVSTLAQRRTYASPPQEGFLRGDNAAYLEALHEDWEADPSSVNTSMRTYFENEAAGRSRSYVSPPGISSVQSQQIVGGANISGEGAAKEILDNLNVVRLIRNYQICGHGKANLDPLGITTGGLSEYINTASLDLSAYNFTDNDLDRTFTLPPGQRVLFDNRPGPFSLREIVDRLKVVYCESIGYEFMHIQDSEKCDWIRNRIESPAVEGFSVEEKKSIAHNLVKSHGFENFLHKKYATEKRFGVDGSESLIPGMIRMIERASSHGVELIVMGMPHRGRLNVLHNVFRKPISMIFNEFTSTTGPEEWGGSGDVKYHLGMSSKVEIEGREMQLSLLANPSHLEAVNPVVVGKVRAEQLLRGDDERKRVMSVLLHGDAAFAGQGVVYESLGLADLPAYTTGGTIHIVVNNQIGFTTDPRESRSSPYCTDIAKFVDAPIFHVNGDDVEAVARCMDIAVEWRQKFGTDVVVDIVCYRRFGHNETDQPKFTQPLMYERIEKQPKTIEFYSQQLIDEGVITAEWLKDEVFKFDKGLEKAYDARETYDSQVDEELALFWQGLVSRESYTEKARNTGIKKKVFDEIGTKITQFPDDLKIHAALQRIIKARTQIFNTGEGIDWATGEALAFGSLLLEGTHVRLSGQDVERGTFSHRHTVIHDQETDGKTYVPLSKLSDDQAPFTVCNSHLSEYGVLGFELGYSQADPHQLIIWEAQFGDFHNTAQCIIDQFICAGEAKWGSQSGLVMLLPHGYEGMGPEHSSARLERFLQMSNDDEDHYPTTDSDDFALKQIIAGNWQVINATTPAQIFHALRRQVLRPFRKPLIVMTPKSLLRHPLAKSSFSEFGEGTCFKRLIPESDEAIYSGSSNNDVRKVIFCSGKVYYDLIQERTSKGITDVAIARVEQLSPFPFDLVHKHADEFPNAEVVWCQEEPRNMGAWSYVAPRFETALAKSDSHQSTRASFAGRPPSASTAAGDKTIHKREVKKLLATAFA
eukprot:m.60001 g.60001  ORF g.60001 m.60001 type:complete len:1002 (-) comp22788_c0_seq1:200-3205(-)